MLGNLFPLVGIGFPLGSGSVIMPTVNWFVTGTIGMGFIVVVFVWWVGLYFVVPRIRGMQLEVAEEVWIMWHEIVRFNLLSDRTSLTSIMISILKVSHSSSELR